MSEAKVQQDILKYLKSKNIYTIKTIQSNKSGVPDIICCVGGQFCAFEVKSNPKAPLSELQKVNLQEIHLAGGLACKVSSVSEVKAHLKSYLKAPLKPKFKVKLDIETINI